MAEIPSSFFDHPFYAFHYFMLNQTFLLNAEKIIEQNRQQTRTTLHQYKKKIVKCPECYKNLSKVSLKAHLKLHELKKQGKKFKCQTCLCEFLTERYLISHMKSHLMAYTCNFCEKCFASQRSLTLHQRKNHSRNLY
jgi:Zinc finger, C2H2 type